MPIFVLREPMGDGQNHCNIALVWESLFAV